MGKVTNECTYNCNISMKYFPFTYQTGYTGLLWKLPPLDILNTKLKHTKGCIPLPLSQQNGRQRKRGRDENERQKKIKRNEKDETDMKKKSVIACTTRNKKPKK